MVVYLWKFLWNKAQTSLHYIKIALCIFVVYLFILAVFANVFKTNKANLHPTKTATTITKQTDGIRAFITDKRLNSTKSGKLIITLYKGGVCSLIGEACYDDLDKKNPANASMFIASIYAYPFLNPPASGVRSTIQTLAQAGFIPQSYAAEGVGFASIRPLMNVWKSMRDVAYLLLVLVIVTIGFMIMLRSKINPQTIVNVENSLPKIVMALVYITFSFAIAGFLIDLMYVSIVMIIGILGPSQTTRTTKEFMTLFLQASPWTIFSILMNFDGGMIFYTLPNALLGILGGVVGGLLRVAILAVTAFLVNPYIGKFLEWLEKIDFPIKAGVVFLDIGLGGLVQAIESIGAKGLSIILSIAVGFIISIFLIGLVIMLTVIMLFFRIFMLLFSNYIKLLVLIVISPLYLLLEAIPGQSSFSGWIKNILELLVPYPVIIATFLIGTIIIEASTQGTLWTPPFLVIINAQYLSAIVGMWILFMIPDFVAIVQKAINPKPLPLDAGIGTFFGGAKTGVETGLGEASKYALLSDRIAPLKRVYEMFGMGAPKQGK
jgi:hypothetical protein